MAIASRLVQCHDLVNTHRSGEIRRVTTAILAAVSDGGAILAPVSDSGAILAPKCMEDIVGIFRATDNEVWQPRVGVVVTKR